VKVKLGVAGAATLLVIVSALFSSASASAAIPFCPPGSGPGQCNGPRGLATDWETGHVYVVDRVNDRVNVFDPNGNSLSSFAVSDPTWVAVDNDELSASHHDIYVTTDSLEVKRFKPSGELVKSFGGKGEGVCKLMNMQAPIAVGPAGTIYVADSYDKDGSGELHVFVNRIQKFDPEGGCIGEVLLFEGDNEAARDLAVDSTGDIYVSVEGGGGVIRKYGPTGTLLGDLGGVQTEGLSIDAADNLFAKQRGAAVTQSKFTYFIAEYAADEVVRRFGYLPGLAAGTSLAALEEAGGEEGVFATEGSAGVNLLRVPKGPVVVPEPCHVKPGGLGSVRATLQAEINPEGKETHFHFEYGEGALTKESDPELLAGSADFELHEATQTIASLKPETTYHCRIVAENADGTTPPGQEGEFETREGFEFGPTFVTEVAEEQATLNAEGNPLGLQATAEIEYVTDAQYQANPADHFAGALHSPPPELDYGAGEAMQLRSLTLTGLQPATTYHWRLHVKNGVPPLGIFCPRNAEEPCPANEHVFRTYGPPEHPDDRGYELVSPAQKNSAEVATPILAAGIFEDRNMLIQVGSGSGEAATYTSFTSFGKDAEGAPSASQYLSRRTPTGWSTENISPFGFQIPILSIPFKGFTPELDLAVFKVSSGVLAPGCPEGVENLYLRNTAAGTLTCLTPEIPQGKGNFSCFDYAGASEAGDRVFFASGASYAGAPEGNGFSLYEWSAEGGLKAISILPGQSAATVPTQASTFGPSLNPDTPSTATNCQFGQTTMRHAVSADGSKAFWTYAPEAFTSLPESPGVQKLTVIGAGTGSTFTLAFKSQTTTPIALEADAAAIQKALELLSTVGAGNVEVGGTGPFTVTFKGSLAGTESQLIADAATGLMARVNGTETVQLDKKQFVGGVSGNGVFVAASKDGSVVYFTSPNKLVSGAKAGPGKPDLYRYDFNQAVNPLTDVTKKSGIVADVQGVIGASDDGSSIYFVARGALTGEEEGPTGQKAKEGALNLYLYREGQTGFIARLSGADQKDWEAQPKNLSARVSPDGRHLAFLSIESPALADYENTVAKGQHCQQDVEIVGLFGGPLCTQAFLYDAETKALSCVSCNPTGERPLGPAALPGWSNVYEGPRYLSDGGSRFFFETFDALARADVNGLRDVYEFERPGTGSCTTASGTYDPRSGGCHFLITSGTASSESYLLDGSSDGRDVFFSTRKKLVGWDTNENFDVYDHRVGGGFPEPVEPVVCTGEGACKPPPTAPPGLGSPATPGFTGPGNPKPKPHHHKKKHKKHKQKKKSHKKAGRR
jgi:hypothetical protein